jgi:hypothetical protein
MKPTRFVVSFCDLFTKDVEHWLRIRTSEIWQVIVFYVTRNLTCTLPVRKQHSIAFYAELGVIIACGIFKNMFLLIY